MLSRRAAYVLTFVFLLSIISSAQDMLPPSWTYSSYFGGSGSDTVQSLTRDSAGNIYIAGVTTSADFPTTSGVYESTYPGPSGAYAIYVAKFSSAGQLAWSTFVGPGETQFTTASSIQVDASQNVYVTGIYQGSGFPTTSGLPSSGDVYVLKLNSTGSKLIYGARLSSDVNGKPALVLDSNADAFVTGTGMCCSAQQTGILGPLGGIDDFWVAEINSAGNALPWSVEIGGTDLDYEEALAIDGSGKLYVTGYSASTDFPTSSGALVQSGTGRAFVMKLDPSKSPSSSMIYSALAGNPGKTKNDLIEGTAIAVDAAGNAYVGAWTYNLGLYTSKYAFQNSPLATPNGYVFELNAAGSGILNGSYLGGDSNDDIFGIAVDSTGNTYLSGFTTSWNFPTTAYGTTYPNYSPGLAFYAKLNPQFAAVSSVEYGGTSGADGGPLALDQNQGMWVGSYTTGGFFTTSNAYQPQYRGSGDGYLLHTDFAGLCSTNTVGFCSITPASNSPELIHFIAQSANVEAAENMALTVDGLSLYNVHGAQFDTWLPIASGSHSASVSVMDNNGKSLNSKQSFTVVSSSTCPLNPVVPSVTFCKPLNTAALGTTVNVVLQSNDPVTSGTLNLFLDGKLVTTLKSQNGTYTYTLTLAAGTHRLAVTGKDAYENPMRAATVFKVQ